MIHYTPLTLEEIFPETHSLTMQFIEYNGRLIEGYEEDGQFTIQKLMSTNPNDFLDETYLPGRKISIKR